MPTMPNLIGLELSEAEASMQSAGVLNPSAIGYFGTWPITVLWKSVALAALILTADSILVTADSILTVDEYVFSLAPGTITAQSILPGAPVLQNAPLQLTVVASPLGQVYP